MLVIVMVVLFWALIVLNSVFFSEASAGRLGNVSAHQGSYEVIPPVMQRGLAIEDPESGQQSLLRADGDADETIPSASNKGRILKLLVLKPAAQLLVMLAAAYLLSKIGGASPDVCT